VILQLRAAIASLDLITLEKMMKKLMSSLLTAAIVGAFSLPAMAANTVQSVPAMPAGHAAATHAAPATAEKPIDAPRKHVASKHGAKKHVSKTHASRHKTG